MNPTGRKFDGSDEKEIPWKRCVHAQECLDWVLDDDNPVQFFVSYEMEGRYLMHSRTNCGTLPDVLLLCFKVTWIAALGVGELTCHFVLLQRL